MYRSYGASEAAKAFERAVARKLHFSSAVDLRTNLVRALDNHGGFEKVVREWHEYRQQGQSGTDKFRQRKRQSMKATSYKKPLRHAGRPPAARFDGGARKKHQRKS